MNRKSFYDKVAFEPNTGCWIWIGATSGCDSEQASYGKIYGKSDGFKLAHRYSFFLHNGEFDRSKLVLHHCDNPFCVNPQHLYLGTNKDNSQDIVRRKRRSWKGVKNSRAKLTDEQVIAIRNEYIPYKNHQGILSAKYGVAASVINKIVRKELWTHI